ncbi:MAG: hypothetical protein MNPFHGCM_01323 [Gemmatimonadaceae bacterium]|nr:hypothetical protein [Gemmatimonadaceae bacterium]
MAKMTLEQLAAQLVAVYGTGLRAIALYGSAARGDRLTTTTNLNVLVVVDEIAMDHLAREAAVTSAWKEAGHPPPLTLTIEEWRGSADIFPMEYADILAHHRMIHGTLPVDGVSVRPRDLRLQLEHEAMSKLLRLRHAVLSAGGEEQAQRALLRDSISSFMTLLRTVVRLNDMEPAVDSDAVLTQLDGRSGIDVAAFRRVLRYARGDATLDRQGVRDALAGYLGAATSLARYADGMGDP